MGIFSPCAYSRLNTRRSFSLITEDLSHVWNSWPGSQLHSEVASVTDSQRRSQEPDETTITKLEKQTQADIYVVRHLYDEELEILQRKAAVTGFIGVIAARPVKQRLPGQELRCAPAEARERWYRRGASRCTPQPPIVECSHGHSERNR